MITLKDVTKEFTVPSGERLTILHPLSLTLERGISCSIMGPSGSGKSTLLALLSGLEHPTRGEIHYDGVNFASLAERDLARLRARQIGIVFQAFHLIPHFSALQNVLVAAEIGGTSEPLGASRRALESVGLAKRMDHVPSRLSGGEQQRVAIARAIVNRPRLLLCDEPTGNLDPTNAKLVLDLLIALREELGASLVLVTHDIGVAEKLPARLTLEAGRVVSKAGPLLQGDGR